MGTKNGDGGASTTAGHDPLAEKAALEASLHAEEQGLLFDDDVSTHPQDLGYRGPTACNAAGITYRQLDYWARTGLVEPTVRSATGSGTQRLYGSRGDRGSSASPSGACGARSRVPWPTCPPSALRRPRPGSPTTSSLPVASPA